MTGNNWYAIGLTSLRQEILVDLGTGTFVPACLKVRENWRREKLNKSENAETNSAHNERVRLG